MTKPKIGVATDPNRPLVGPTPSYDTPLIIKSGDELPAMGEELTISKAKHRGRVGGGRRTYINRRVRARTSGVPLSRRVLLSAGIILYQWD